MRLLFASVLLLGSLVGCKGDAPPAIDADPRGPKCSMKFFDLCSEEHDCPAPMLCQNFAAQGFQVCTTSCDASNPCPDDKSGSPATCDQGICIPSAPNMCHI